MGSSGEGSHLESLSWGRVVGGRVHVGLAKHDHPHVSVQVDLPGLGAGESVGENNVHVRVRLHYVTKPCDISQMTV